MDQKEIRRIEKHETDAVMFDVGIRDNRLVAIDEGEVFATQRGIETEIEFLIRAEDVFVRICNSTKGVNI